MRKIASGAVELWTYRFLWVIKDEEWGLYIELQGGTRSGREDSSMVFTTRGSIKPRPQVCFCNALLMDLDVGRVWFCGCPTGWVPKVGRTQGTNAKDSFKNMSETGLRWRWALDCMVKREGDKKVAWRWVMGDSNIRGRD
ncbi:hypothetical protein SDJN03_01634, partial [Cucurbita argyrosperma subsp. sororia]